MNDYDTTVHSYLTSHQSRRDVIDMCVNLKPSHFITLNTNAMASMGLHTGQQRINYFHGALDRKLIGSRWANRPYEERCHSISIPEGHPAYRQTSLVKLHYHLLTALAPHTRRMMSNEELIELVGNLWSTAVPGGDVDVQCVYDAAGAAGYATKYLAGLGAIGITGYCVN